VVKAISLILSLDEYLQRTGQSNERSTVSGQTTLRTTASVLNDPIPGG
jgi:hypothetical protein